VVNYRTRGVCYIAVTILSSPLLQDFGMTPVLWYWTFRELLKSDFVAEGATKKN